MGRFTALPNARNEAGEGWREPFRSASHVPCQNDALRTRSLQCAVKSWLQRSLFAT